MDTGSNTKHDPLTQMNDTPLDMRSCYEILEALGLRRKSEITTSRLNNRNNNNIEIENKNVPEDNKTRKCTKCNITFKSTIKYNRHREKNHQCSKILYCKICSKTFRNSELLLKHKSCHSGEQPYCCVHCNAKFSTLQTLTAHLRRHAGKLPYTCKICKVGFELYSSYLDHQNLHVLPKAHPKPKLFKCENCSREFRKLCDLERHTRVHTGEKPYICKICQNRFQQAHNLTKHMIIHTKEKLYKCDVCGKNFGRSDVLMRHMITHSVNKPHPCRFCEKSFGRFSQVLDHVKKYHSDSDLV